MDTTLLEDSVGARCMVLSENNQLLFLGEIAYYDEVNNIIRISQTGERGSDEDTYTRRFVRPYDRVKIHIKEEKLHRLILVEGTVEQTINNYFFLAIQDVIEKDEEREYFRQIVMHESLISFVNRKAAGHPCMIVDVSATGISVKCNEIYQIGDCLWIYSQPLRPGGPLHNLEFLIVRKNTLETGRYRYFYGCQFVNLSTDAQDKLFSDIFTLQARNLRSSRNK